MLTRALKRITRQGTATAVQVAGAAAVVTSVGLLAGVAWCLLAGGIALLAFGVAVEVS